MRSQTTYLMLLAALALPACSTTYTSPASVALCETLDLEGWKSWSGSGYEIKVEDVSYLVSYGDSQAGLTSKPEGSPVFWIELGGFSAGRAAGMKAPPMMYDPKNARLRLNGVVIAASPELWSSEFTYGRSRPVTAQPRPLDLQSGEKFFVAFPVKAPAPTDKYEVDLGAVSLGGTLRQIPVKKSCHTPQKTWTEPFTLHIS